MIDFMKGVVSESDKKCLQLHNVIYHRGKKETEWKDAIDIIYTNLRTGEKKLHTIVEPEIDIYFVKEEFRNYRHNKAYMEIDKCECKRVKYRHLIYEIAKEGGPELQNVLNECKASGNYQAMNNILKYRYVFGVDIKPEALYRIYWKYFYDNSLPKKVTKTFADIEVNIKEIGGVFPKNGNASICMNSLYDEETKTMFTFCLRMKDNPSQVEFEKNIDKAIANLHEMFDESYDKDIQYKVFMYDDERKLIADIFNLTNTLKRDYLEFWNGHGFDIPYIIDRMKVLGIDPQKTACHCDFKYKELYVYEDRNSFQASTKKSYCQFSGYTEIVDQMLLYAQVRKGGSELRSNKLSSIGEHTIKDKKLNYGEASNLSELPYVNYEMYFQYSVKDVLLQAFIEKKEKDLDNIYVRLDANVTPTNKCFSQTIFLHNRSYYEHLLLNMLPGSNVNIDYGNNTREESKIRFSGALVGDPTLNDFTGAIINGRRSKYVFKHVIDFDFSSMYPNTKLAFNIDPSSLIGKLFINENPETLAKNLYMASLSEEEREKQLIKEAQLAGEEYVKESSEIVVKEGDKTDYGKESTLNTVVDSGQVFIDRYLCGDTATAMIGKIYFNLPSVEEVCQEIESRYFSNKMATNL